MNHILKAFILCICVASIFAAVTNNKRDEEGELTEIQIKFKNDHLNNNTPSKSTESSMLSGLLSAISRMMKLEKPNQRETVINVASSEDEEQQPKPGVNATRSKRQAGYGGGYGGPAQGGYPSAGPAPYGGGGYGAPPGGPFDDFGYDYLNQADFLYDYYDWVCTETDCQLCNILTSECCDPTVSVNCVLPDTCFNNPCLSGGTCIPTQTFGNADFICACLPGFTGKYCQLTNDYLWPSFPAPPPPFRPGPPAGPAPYGPPRPAGPAPYAPPQAPYQPPAQPAPYQPPQAPAQPSYGGSGGGYARPGPQQGPSPLAGAPLGGAPLGGAPMGAPIPAPVGRIAAPVARPLSAKALDFPGFGCDCQGRGRCTEVDTENGEEYFCLCNNGKYGSTCLEDFFNPCDRVENLQAKYAPADARLPRYYFLECRTGVPFLRRCDADKRWSPKLEKCMPIKKSSSTMQQQPMI